MFTTNSLPNTTQATIQYQTTDPGIKQPKIEGQKSNQQEFPQFCYTTNVSQTSHLSPHKKKLIKKT